MGLVIENLSVDIQGKSVLRNVSLSVESGHVTAVLGANGAGKSELVLAVAGTLAYTQGQIMVDGNSIHGYSPNLVRKSGVAAVPEGHRVLTRLSVDDNLRVAGSILDTSLIEKALHEVYDLFPELAERQSQIAGTMSGGQQQMLAIGHALMARPKYLLIDEMSLGLAPLIVKRLVRVLESLVNKGVGVVLVEQFTEVALSVATTVVVMRTGEVCFNGPASEIRTKPEILKSAYF